MPSQFARFLALAVLCLALTIPYAVVNHTYPIPTFYAEFSALALYLALGATVALIVRVTEPRVPFATPMVALMPLAFGVLLIAQTVLLPVAQPSMNWLGGGYLLASFVTVHTGFGLVRAGLADKALRWSAAALIVGGLFAVFCQIVQLFHIEAKFTPFIVAYNVMIERRPFGNMAQANHLATYIAFATAGALYLRADAAAAGDRVARAVGDIFRGTRAHRVARTLAADGGDRRRRVLDGVRAGAAGIGRGVRRPGQARCARVVDPGRARACCFSP